MSVTLSFVMIMLCVPIQLEDFSVPVNVVIVEMEDTIALVSCPFYWLIYIHVFSCLLLDIDECLVNTNSCNISTSMCVNSNGSYFCQCLDGFMNISRLHCASMCIDKM